MTDGLMEGQTDRGVHNIPIAFFFFFFFFFFFKKKKHWDKTNMLSRAINFQLAYLYEMERTFLTLSPLEISA